jgi:dihydrodipicolinate synthase/N-acetylneuraminate lyase
MPRAAAMRWSGVIPALTTSLRASGALDERAMGRHCDWLIRKGVAGLVCCGSLGEAATLSFEEKLAVAEICVRASAGRVPVALGVAALSTRVAVALARAGARAGCSGLMVLPPYAPPRRARATRPGRRSRGLRSSPWRPRARPRRRRRRGRPAARAARPGARAAR